jgi:NAD(P)H-hydrate epimerase
MIVVLKNAYTAVCLPSGEVHFNSSGCAAMATAGSGDVLTGIITSLLAQGYEPGEAAITGVYIHGKAGEKAAAEKGEHGVVASDLVNALWQE